jgi:hypothetical protein
MMGALHGGLARTAHALQAPAAHCALPLYSGLFNPRLRHRGENPGLAQRAEALPDSIPHPFAPEKAFDRSRMDFRAQAEAASNVIGCPTFAASNLRYP